MKEWLNASYVLLSRDSCSPLGLIQVIFQLEETVKWKPAVGRAAKCDWQCPLFCEPADVNKANIAFSGIWR